MEKHHIQGRSPFFSQFSLESISQTKPEVFLLGGSKSSLVEFEKCLLHLWKMKSDYILAQLVYHPLFLLLRLPVSLDEPICRNAQAGIQNPPHISGKQTRGR